MTRRDFEIRAAEFFLCGDNVKEQYEELLNLDYNDSPNGRDCPNGGITVWEPFEFFTTGFLLEQIDQLADNYEEFYNMTNEQFREE